MIGPPFPSDALAVRLFVSYRDKLGKSLSDMQNSIAAIKRKHFDSDEPHPFDNRLFKNQIERIKKRHAGRTAGQAAPLDWHAVERIRMHLAEKPCTPKTAETMALVSIMSAIGLRRSEAAAILWEDVKTERGGSGRVLIRRSKTDQTGKGKWLAFNADVVADLERLRKLRPPTEDEGRVFPLNGEQISYRIRKVADAAKCAPASRGIPGASAWCTG